MLKTRTFLFRLFLVFVAALTLYFSVPPKVAEIQGRFVPGVSAGQAIYTRILRWNPHNSGALTSLAEIAKEQGDFDEARTYALQALSVDPTNGRATAQLIPVYEQHQDAVYLQQALAIAPRQWPVHSYVRVALADYWAGQGDIEKVLAEWDFLLTRHRGLYKPIFPVLLTYANSESRDLLNSYASRPSSWWQDFFVYMVQHDADLSILQYFYQLRVSSGIPLEKNERNAYVKRLQQARLWKLAYSTWVSGLSSKEFDLIGSLYDGGFEGVGHGTGFDWYFRQSRQAKVSLGRTHGVKGKRGLHVVFKRRKAIRFNHVSQRLLLESGQHYKMTMQSRIDNLENPQGLVWRITCADESSQVFATSPAVKGSKKWHEIAFEFTVPDQGCESQMLRLEAASKYHHEQSFKGGVWFDEMTILPVMSPAASTL